jgi:hypothetical protein
VTPGNDPPSSGDGTPTKTGRTASGATDDKADSDKAPVKVLLQAFSPGAVPQNVTGDDNVLHATAVAALLPFKAPISAAGQALDELRAQLGASFDPSAPGTSLAGGLGSAAPRFAPWIVLLVMAWLVRMVIASVLADRTAGPRRRRWTLL